MTTTENKPVNTLRYEERAFVRCALLDEITKHCQKWLMKKDVAHFVLEGMYANTIMRSSFSDEHLTPKSNQQNQQR